MNERERRELARWFDGRSDATLRSSLKWAAVSIGVALILWPIFRLFMPPAGALGSAVIVASVLAFASFTDYLNRLQMKRRCRPKYDRALANGTVAVERVEAFGVIELQEREYEGPTYYFDVGDGCVLCLGGQRMYSLRDLPWPSTVFEIVSTVEPEVSLGIFPSGEELEPRLSTADYQAYPDVPVGLSQKSLDEIEGEIRSHFAARS
jgi:hypothetical protein